MGQHLGLTKSGCGDLSKELPVLLLKHYRVLSRTNFLGTALANRNFGCPVGGNDALHACSFALGSSVEALVRLLHPIRLHL